MHQQDISCVGDAVMREKKEFININEIILKALDDDISSERFAHLDELIVNDPSIAQHYVEFMATQVGLCESAGAFATSFNNTNDELLWQALAESEKTAAGIQIEKPSDSTKEVIEQDLARQQNLHLPRRRVSKLSLFTAIGSIAALLIILAYVYTHPRQLPPVVATLTESIDAKWSNPILPVTGDSDIRAGSMELVSGYAKILFDCGAEIIVQAPAEFEAISMDRLLLNRGRLTANVPKSAFGFTVSTPNARIVDLGTEFGVMVGPSGCSDVYVFQGEVALSPDQQQVNSTQRTRHLITEGFAKRVEADNSVKDLGFNESPFVRKTEFNISLKASQGSRYHRWLAYSYRLRYDIDLVAYYTFERGPGEPDKLINTSSAFAGRLNGILGSDISGNLQPAWIGGRWPQKRALSFDSTKAHHVTVPYDPALDLYGTVTICAWVYREGPRGGGHIVSKRFEEQVNFQFAFFGNDVGGYSHRMQFGTGDISEELNRAFCYSTNPILQTDQWQHVAAAFDGSEVRFYLNGRLAARQAYIKPAGVIEADMLIGKHGLKTDSSYFHGKMDELAVFKRVLSDSEIRNMYEKGCPWR
jgi:hypothetical protein